MNAVPHEQRRLIHVITPGDHFSPSTGSATVSVVHGLSAATPAGAPRPAVLVGTGTYADRYDSAEVIEYVERPAHHTDRYVDVLMARLGGTRIRARERYRAALVDQQSWDPAFVIGHNAVQLIPSVDARHLAVLYAHNDLLRTYRRREAAASLRNVRAVVAVSSDLAGRLQSSLPRELRDRVEVVVNGVDVAAFDAPTRTRGERLRVAFVGRMVPDKGADVAVEALARLNRTDIEATFIGSEGFDAARPRSAYELELRRKAEPLGDRVSFLSFQPRRQVAELLREADAVLVPSRWPDPCPLTVLEGMAAGAAVVASEIGGIPEVAGGAATLVPPGDAAALADVLAALADDEGLLARKQAEALGRARGRDWGVVARELAEALNRHA